MGCPCLCLAAPVTEGSFSSVRRMHTNILRPLGTFDWQLCLAKLSPLAEGEVLSPAHFSLLTPPFSISPSLG